MATAGSPSAHPTTAIKHDQCCVPPIDLKVSSVLKPLKSLGLSTLMRGLL
jgi:hypothetical protein